MPLASTSPNLTQSDPVVTVPSASRIRRGSAWARNAAPGEEVLKP
jgi:hypothetical protein